MTPQITEEQEWEKEFNTLWDRAELEVCTRIKTMGTQTLDYYEYETSQGAVAEDVRQFIKKLLASHSAQAAHDAASACVKAVDRMILHDPNHCRRMVDPNEKCCLSNAVAAVRSASQPYLKGD